MEEEKSYFDEEAQESVETPELEASAEPVEENQQDIMRRRVLF